jgi:hypothetical protein
MDSTTSPRTGFDLPAVAGADDVLTVDIAIRNRSTVVRTAVRQHVEPAGRGAHHSDRLGAPPGRRNRGDLEGCRDLGNPDQPGRADLSDVGVGAERPRDRARQRAWRRTWARTSDHLGANADHWLVGVKPEFVDQTRADGEHSRRLGGAPDRRAPSHSNGKGGATAAAEIVRGGFSDLATAIPRSERIATALERRRSAAARRRPGPGQDRRDAPRSRFRSAGAKQAGLKVRFVYRGVRLVARHRAGASYEASAERECLTSMASDPAAAVAGIRSGSRRAGAESGRPAPVPSSLRRSEPRAATRMGRVVRAASVRLPRHRNRRCLVAA